MSTGLIIVMIIGIPAAIAIAYGVGNLTREVASTTSSSGNKSLANIIITIVVGFIAMLAIGYVLDLTGCVDGDDIRGPITELRI